MIRTLDEAIKYHRTIASKIKKTAHYLRMKGHEKGADDSEKCASDHEQLAEWLTELKERREADRWIPVSERTPNDLEPVNITWINHEPEPYYKEIKGKPFTATGVYFNGQWYWWSTLCIDTLAEYGHSYDDIIDKDIEVTAWKPLPKSYESEAESLDYQRAVEDTEYCERHEPTYNPDDGSM